MDELTKPWFPEIPILQYEVNLTHQLFRDNYLLRQTMAYLGLAIYVICLVVISEIFAIPPKCKYTFRYMFDQITKYLLTDQWLLA